MRPGMAVPWRFHFFHFVTLRAMFAHGEQGMNQAQMRGCRTAICHEAKCRLSTYSSHKPIVIT
jgi:hypothetical protein